MPRCRSRSVTEGAVAAVGENLEVVGDRLRGHHPLQTQAGSLLIAIEETQLGEGDVIVLIAVDEALDLAVRGQGLELVVAGQFEAAEASSGGAFDDVEGNDVLLRGGMAGDTRQHADVQVGLGKPGGMSGCHGCQLVATAASPVHVGPGDLRRAAHLVGVVAVAAGGVLVMAAGCVLLGDFGMTFLATGLTRGQPVIGVAGAHRGVTAGAAELGVYGGVEDRRVDGKGLANRGAVAVAGEAVVTCRREGGKGGQTEKKPAA